MNGGRLRVLELYCGIGGLAAALEPAADVAEVVAAVDVNQRALDVYRYNFPAHPVLAAAVESIAAERWQSWDADLWWMSPPCQPFTRRGRQRDLEDPRATNLLTVLERIAEFRPRYVALENVPPFRGSRLHARLLRTLEGAGYSAVRETVLCPTELGIPNRRRRYYLVAGRTPLHPTLSPEGRESQPLVPLAAKLDREPSPSLDVAPDLAGRYAGALDVVEPGDPGAVTACFTSAYGRSPVRSGSYLANGPRGSIRRFSPAEVLRLLGFPSRFRLACGFPPGDSPGNDDLPASVGWRLAGNSLSIAAVRAVLAAIPDLASALSS